MFELQYDDLESAVATLEAMVGHERGLPTAAAALPEQTHA
jgi:hypothetical protein